MAAPTNHFKLGLFVIISFSAAVVTGIALGSEAMKKETTKYHTYFNESVQGLDVGAPVKFRGVTIGSVSPRSRSRRTIATSTWSRSSTSRTSAAWASRRRRPAAR